MKILYLCHIDWAWIKQRPQFIAEQLGLSNEISVYYQPSLNKKNLQKNNLNENDVDFSIRKLIKIPLKNKYLLLFKINNLIQRLQIYTIAKFKKYDVIYVTHPEFFEVIPKSTKIPVIYDCMDDHEHFYDADVWQRKLFKILEEKLIVFSKLVICSSRNLEKKIINCGGKNVLLVRNGLRETLLDSYKSSCKNYSYKVIRENKIKLIYFGTVSSWFDVDLLENVCNSFENVYVDIYGPLEIDLTHRHENIQYKGIAEHKDLISIAQDATALIMPFVVNKLIESVDPVKLYEYLAFNRPIISCYYQELNHFGDLINTYKSKEQLFDLIIRLENNSIETPVNDDVVKFLTCTSWSDRAKLINENMGKIVIY